MLRKILPLAFSLALLLSACGAQGTPTLAPAEVEGTAVSSAWTMVAMTQAAIPTATPLPPTEIPSPTPLPTFTPLPPPTTDPALLVLPTATLAASTSGGGGCDHTLDFAEAGPKSPVRFENQTKGSITLSLKIYTPNGHAQCGYFSYSLAKNEKMVQSIPKGDYWAWAWINNTASSEGYFTNRVGEDEIFTVFIRDDLIVAP